MGEIGYEMGYMMCIYICKVEKDEEGRIDGIGMTRKRRSSENE